MLDPDPGQLNANPQTLQRHYCTLRLLNCSSIYFSLYLWLYSLSLLSPDLEHVAGAGEEIIAILVKWHRHHPVGKNTTSICMDFGKKTAKNNRRSFPVLRAKFLSSPFRRRHVRSRENCLSIKRNFVKGKSFAKRKTFKQKQKSPQILIRTGNEIKE